MLPNALLRTSASKNLLPPVRQMFKLFEPFKPFKLFDVFGAFAFALGAGPLFPQPDGG